MTTDAVDYLRPATAADALASMRERQAAVFASGMTALQLVWDGETPYVPVIDVSGLDFGPDVSTEPDGQLTLSANARLQRLADDQTLGGHLPCLPRFLPFLASPGVRNLATLGGNLMWGAGDLEVLFAALDARLSFSNGETVAITDRSAFPAGELLLSATVPPARAGSVFVEKLGFRQAFSPARVVVAGRRSGPSCRLALRLAGSSVRLLDVTWADAPDRIDELLWDGDDAFLARAARNLLAGHLRHMNEGTAS